MKSLFVIGIGGWLCWQATDLASDDLLPGVLAPIGLVLFCAWGAGWLASKLGLGGGSSSADFGDFGGGD